MTPPPSSSRPIPNPRQPDVGIRPPGDLAPTPAPVPVRRRTVPIDERSGLRDLYKRVPLPTPPPEEGKARQRRRYEGDVDRVAPERPAPGPSPVRPIAPPKNEPPRAGVRPITPRPAPLPGTSPRYRLPQPNPKPTPTPPTRRLEPRDPGLGSPPPSDRSFDSGRESAPWTRGRSDRTFSGSKPWGVNAAGNRIYGDWSRFHFAPSSFCYGYVPAWCRWGYYCWPAYYSWYYPRYYDWSCGASTWSSSYVFHWDSHDVRRHRFWYWPTRVYAPSIVYDYGSSDYAGEAAYAPATHVTMSTAPAVIDVSIPMRAAAPSPTTLAERHVELGDFYFTDGRYEDAAESYLRALAYVPEDASVHFALADALFALGDYHYAAFMLTKALELNPAMAGVTADKRTFYGEPEAFDAQLDTLRRYLREKPYDAAAHLLLGYNLRMSGDTDGAKAAFERVLEIDKHSTPAQLFLDAIAAAAKDGRP